MIFPPMVLQYLSTRLINKTYLMPIPTHCFVHYFHRSSLPMCSSILNLLRFPFLSRENGLLIEKFSVDMERITPRRTGFAGLGSSPKNSETFVVFLAAIPPIHCRYYKITGVIKCL